jgi:hypothetical protein
MQRSLLCTLFILVMASLAFSQATVTKFPFGAYVGMYHGFFDGSLNQPSNQYTSDVWKLWNRVLGFNTAFETFYMSRGFTSVPNSPVTGYRVCKEFLMKPGNGNLLSPILESRVLEIPSRQKLYERADNHAPGISDLAEGQYILFRTLLRSFARENPDGIHTPVARDAVIRIDTSSRGISVSNIGAIGWEGLIFDDIQVNASEWSGDRYTNRYTFRKRNFNFHNDTTFLYLRLVIDNSAPTSRASRLHCRLFDRNYPDRVLVDAQFEVRDGTIVLPFSIHESGDPFYWLFSPTLELRGESLQPSCSFTLKSLSIYDAIGKAVVEDNILQSTTPVNYNTLIDDGILYIASPNRTPNPLRSIVCLADEANIGNIRPMCVVRDYIQARARGNCYFYIVQPEGTYETNFTTFNRVLSEVGTGRLYVAPNPYPIRWDPSNRNSDYIETNYRVMLAESPRKTSAFAERLRLLQEDVRRNFSPALPTMFVILQSQEDRAPMVNLQLPSAPEIIAQGFISLLANYKGILSYQIDPGATPTNRNIYRDESRHPDQFFHSARQESSIQDSARIGHRAIADVLNSRVIGSTAYPTLGDFLLAANVESFELIGRSLYVNSATSLRLAGQDNVALGQAHIVNNNGSPATRAALIGIGYAKLPNSPIGTSYYLLMNLNRDTSTSMVSLTFKSTSYRSIRVSDLTAGSITDKVYSVNEAVQLTVPKMRGILVKVAGQR